MGMTDYLEGKLSDHTVRHVSYTSPTTVYLALFTSATDDTGGGTECTGGSYARQAATFSASWITSGTITFTNMPACTVTHAALFDASTSGNMLYHNALGSSKTVPAGATLTIAAGDVTVVLT